MDAHRPGRSLPTTPTPPPRPGTSRASNEQLRAWADAATRGDTEAFTRLYQSCRGWVMARCRTRLPLHDAEDVCAEVFTRAWHHLAAGRQIDHPLAWLATVTRHLIIDHHKRASRNVPVGDLTDTDAGHRLPDPSPGPAELATMADVAPIVAAWIADLSPAAKEAITGCMTAEEQAITSHHAACSLPALRSSLYRARRLLRARLGRRDLPCPPMHSR